MIWAWGVDTRTATGQGFIRQMMVLFNESILLLRDEPVRHGLLAAKVVKMYRVIQWFRTEAGRRSADDALDRFVSLLGGIARDIALG